MFLSFPCFKFINVNVIDEERNRYFCITTNNNTSSSLAISSRTNTSNGRNRVSPSETSRERNRRRQNRQLVDNNGRGDADEDENEDESGSSSGTNTPPSSHRRRVLVNRTEKYTLSAIRLQMKEKERSISQQKQSEILRVNRDPYPTSTSYMRALLTNPYSQLSSGKIAHLYKRTSLSRFKRQRLWIIKPSDVDNPVYTAGCDIECMSIDREGGDLFIGTTNGMADAISLKIIKDNGSTYLQNSRTIKSWNSPITSINVGMDRMILCTTLGGEGSSGSAFVGKIDKNEESGVFYGLSTRVEYGAKHHKSIFCSSIGNNNSLIYGTSKQVVEINTSRDYHRLQFNTGSDVLSVKFRGEGTNSVHSFFAAGCRNGLILFYDTRQRARQLIPQREMTYINHGSTVTNMQWVSLNNEPTNNSNYLLVSGLGGKINLYDIRNIKKDNTNNLFSHFDHKSSIQNLDLTESVISYMGYYNDYLINHGFSVSHDDQYFAISTSDSIVKIYDIWN